MGKLRLGVVGAGGIANNIHLPILSRLDGVDIRAVCDLRVERAKHAAELFRIPALYGSHRAMLAAEELDAVFVLTKPDELFRAASDCLNANLAVFMEKPMGITAYQAQTLENLAKDCNKLLHVGYNRRYVPLVVETVRLARSFGDITQVEGRFYKNSSPAFHGGCASAFTCDVVHAVDLVRYIAGCDKVAKAATIKLYP